MQRHRRERLEAEVARLSGAGLDLVALWRACAPVLAEAVPHYLAPCAYALDPASHLVTSHFQEGLPEFPPEWLAAEYAGTDVNQIVDVVRSPTGISTLHEATGGEPSRSPRWAANREYGADQELIVALRTRGGDAWGALGLYREPDRPLFDAEEQSFLRTVGPVLAGGIRRALLLGEATDPEGEDGPGLIVLDDRWRACSWSADAERWLAELPDGDWSPHHLPPVVQAVAGRAVAGGGASAAEDTTARISTRTHRWMTVHGTVLAGPEPRVAVVLEPSRPARIAPLLMAAYGLTDREQAVTRLVLQGYATAEIADRLVISPHTVQQHLKGVFDKTGVRSRRELVGQVFFTHYEPRFRDNERRALGGRPLRGGPMPATASGAGG